MITEHWGPWKLKRGYPQVFGYVQAFGYPTGATQAFEYAQAFGSYVQAFGFPTGVTHERLDPQRGLHTGVWSLKWAIL